MIDEKMVLLGQRIKDRRIELKYTQAELAEMVGYTSDSIITKIEKGEADPPRSKIIALAKALMVDPAFLMGWADDEGNTDLSKIPGIIPLHKARRIPMVGTIACGSPIWADENISSYYVVDKHLNADFCLRVKGDSMINEGIREGDVAFFKKTSTVNNGNIAAVLIGCEATLKKFYKTDKGIILQSANDKYPPMIINGNDAEEILILGKLVAHLHAHK